jgi:sporulation protein YlmC with PRC-barrel domain
MKIEKISDVLGSRVYTDSGDFFGEVEEANLLDNKIDSWKIKIGGSLISSLGGARGVIIPHQFVKSIGDVFIISKSALPVSNESIEEIPEDLI